MIIVIEPICIGYQHVQFNATFLRYLQSKYQDDQLFFYGDSTHILHISNELKRAQLERIKFIPTDLPERKSSFSDRISIDVSILYQVLRSHEAVKSFYFTCVNPSVIWAWKLLYLVNRRIPVRMVLHGGLGVIGSWRSRNPFVRMADLIGSISLFNTAQLKFLLLEKPIYDSAVSAIPRLKKNADIFPHPVGLICSEVSLPSEFPEADINFGFLGSTSISKGYDKFVAAFRKLSSEGPRNVKFHSIGHIVDDFCSKEFSTHLGPWDSPLDRETFIDYVKKLHYVCFPYDKKHYTYSASGALMDAIAFCKPLIVSDIPLFSQLFHEYGDIGFLYDQSESLESVINDILNNYSPHRYRIQVKNVQKIAFDRLPENIQVSI